MVNMHLGDFDTDRFEITLLCSDCLKDFPDYTMCMPYCDWKSEEYGIIRIFALTNNAWLNRTMNYPNVGSPDLIQENAGEK